jgi:2-iminobutanoate/2-iminopropanoate deaminase
MKKEIVRVGVERPNPNLSPATKFGNLVFVAGQTGRHPATGEVGKDIREQTRNTLERIKVILAAAGTSLDNVLSAMTHLTRVENLTAYNEEYPSATSRQTRASACSSWSSIREPRSSSRGERASSGIERTSTSWRGRSERSRSRSTRSWR